MPVSITAKRAELIAIPGIPLIKPGDPLPGIVLAAARQAKIAIRGNDVLVLAQKVVSKAEGRLVHLATVVPSERAKALANQTQKDPRLVEIILQESAQILRARPGLIISEHRLGFICANAGVDHSNVRGDDQWVLLLPKDPDRSAQQMRSAIRDAVGVDIAVIINDSHGRAWRLGIVGTAIGVAGMHPLSNLRGQPDLTGRPLQVTEVGTADEIAAAASLLMGQSAEAIPAVLVRGVPYLAGTGRVRDLLRPPELDLFR